MNSVNSKAQSQVSAVSSEKAQSEVPAVSSESISLESAEQSKAPVYNRGDTVEELGYAVFAPEADIDSIENPQEITAYLDEFKDNIIVSGTIKVLNLTDGKKITSFIETEDSFSVTEEIDNIQNTVSFNKLSGGVAREHNEFSENGEPYLMEWTFENPDGTCIRGNRRVIDGIAYTEETRSENGREILYEKHREHNGRSYILHFKNQSDEFVYTYNSDMVVIKIVYEKTDPVYEYGEYFYSETDTQNRAFISMNWKLKNGTTVTYTAETAPYGVTSVERPIF